MNINFMLSQKINVNLLILVHPFICDFLTNNKVTSFSLIIYQHMINNGLIKQTSNGMYALLPLGMRILDKLTKIVDTEMTKIGAQKILLPALTPTHLWKKTERFDESRAELFTLKDKNDKQYVLSPVSFGHKYKF